MFRDCRFLLSLQLRLLLTLAAPVTNPSAGRNWTTTHQTAPSGHVTYITRGGASLGLCSHYHLCRYRGCEAQSGPALCQCDENCSFFGDCCEDYARVCATMKGSDAAENPQVLKMVNAAKLKINQFGCHEVKGRDRGYLFVSDCGEHQRNSDVSRKCSEQNPGSYLATAHVTSLTNGLSYKNVYCALCSGESVADLEAWPVGVTCSANASGLGEAAQLFGSSSAVPPSRVFEDLDCRAEATLTSAAVDGLASSIHLPRPCFPHIVSTCPDEHILYTSCHSYTAVIRTTLGLYKNPHCALCNLPMPPLTNHTRCTSRAPVTNEYVHFGNGPGPGRVSPPISILLDFRSSSHVKLLRQQTVIAEEEVTCPTGHVFDPFASHCRRLFCREGYTLTGDHQCAPTRRQRNVDSEPGGAVLEVHAPLARTPNSKEPYCPIDSDKSKSCLAYVLGLDVHNIHQVPDAYSKAFGIQNTFEEEFCFHTYLVEGTERSFESTWAALLLPLTDMPRLHRCNMSGTWSIELYSHKNTTRLARCKTRPVNETQQLTRGGAYNSTSLAINGQLYPIENVTLRASFRQDGTTFTKSVDVEVCEEVSLACPLVQLNRTLFRMRSDADESVEYLPTGRVFSKWEYADADGDGLLLCSFMDRRGTQNTSSTVTFLDFSETQAVLSLVGNIVSMVAAGATFLTYFVFDVLRNHATCCVMNLVASLFIAQLLLLLTGSATANPAGCVMVAALGHYFWLVNILWAAVLAYDLHRTFAGSAGNISRPVGDAGRRPRLRSYALLAWGGGLLVVVPCLVVHLCDCTDLQLWYGDSRVCWIGGEMANLAVFGAPLGAVLLSNLFLFAKTVWGIRRMRQETLRVKKHVSKARMVKEELLIYIRISSLMGFTWIAGFAAAASDVPGLWFVFIGLNSCQGVLIFLSFACKPRVRMLWMEAFCAETTRQRRYSLGMASSSASATRNSRV